MIIAPILFIMKCLMRSEGQLTTFCCFRICVDGHSILYMRNRGIIFGLSLHLIQNSLCVREARVLARLHGCASSSEPSLPYSSNSLCAGYNITASTPRAAFSHFECSSEISCLKTAQIQTSWLLTKQLIRISSGFYTVCKKIFLLEYN